MEKFIQENQLGEISKTMSFKNITSIGCGGKIKTAYFPKDIASLCKVIKKCNENQMPYLIVGNGTNILALDKEYEELVIILNKLPYDYKVEDGKIVCSAFYPSPKIAQELCNKQIKTLAFLAGVPGLIGGAVKQNSGAYKEEISDYILSVKVIDEKGEIKEYQAEDLKYAYRKSIFHENREIIIEASFKVEYDENIKNQNEIRKLKRKESQPLNTKNMGSIFKNPGLCFAWEVIDKLGLRGYRINDAAVSMKHANFIINLNHAKSQDVLDLIELIKKNSYYQFGLLLETEINILK